MKKQKESNHSGWAITSFILGILSLLFCWIPFYSMYDILLSITAIIISGMALRKEQANRGLIIAGLVTGIIALVISLIITFITFVLVWLFSR